MRSGIPRFGVLFERLWPVTGGGYRIGDEVVWP
jgi:hypothetical protein